MPGSSGLDNDTLKLWEREYQKIQVEIDVIQKYMDNLLISKNIIDKGNIIKKPSRLN